MRRGQLLLQRAVAELRGEAVAGLLRQRDAVRSEADAVPRQEDCDQQQDRADRRDERAVSLSRGRHRSLIEPRAARLELRSAPAGDQACSPSSRATARAAAALQSRSPPAAPLVLAEHDRRNRVQLGHPPDDLRAFAEQLRRALRRRASRRRESRARSCRSPARGRTRGARSEAPPAPLPRRSRRPASSRRSSRGRARRASSRAGRACRSSTRRRPARSRRGRARCAS